MQKSVKNVQHKWTILNLFSVFLPRLIDLIRLHGSESDLPEFNMKRKPSKEEYVAIIFKLLASKFDNDIEAVSKYLELETLAPIKKGFGVRGTGFGASAPKKSPPND